MMPDCHQESSMGADISLVLHFLVRLVTAQGLFYKCLSHRLEASRRHLQYLGIPHVHNMHKVYWSLNLLPTALQ